MFCQVLLFRVRAFLIAQSIPVTKHDTGSYGLLKVYHCLEESATSRKDGRIISLLVCPDPSSTFLCKF